MTEYYVNITDKPITDLDAVQFRLKCGETDTVCVLNSTDWNAFSERITQIEEENETLITEQIRDVIRRLQEGTEPVAYSNATGSMKKLTTQEVISFDDVKNNLSDVNTLKTTIKSLPNKLEKTSSITITNSNDNVQANSMDGWVVERGTNNGSCIINQTTIQMNRFVGSAMFSVGQNDVRFRLKSPNISSSANVLYGEDENTTNGFTQANVWREITIHKGHSLVIEASELTTVTLEYEMYVYHKEMNTIADIIYPIGAIYMSVNDISPSLLFGGNWERLSDRFLIGAGSYSAGATGGSSTVSLTQAQMPRHKHTQATHNHGVTNSANSNSKFMTSTDDVKVNSSYYRKKTDQTTKDNGWHYVYVDKDTTNPKGIDGVTSTKNATPVINHTGGTGSTNADANGSAHENMPPYLVVYMWKRTE